MYKSLIKFIVIFLGILIFLAFIAIIYGSYIKLSNNDDYNLKKFNLNIKSSEIVYEAKPIEDNKILFQIYNVENDTVTNKRFIIYDIKKNIIIREID